MPLVLIDGDLEYIGEKIQDATVESWNNKEDRYTTVLRGFTVHIAKLKTLPQTVRDPVQAE